VKFTVQKTKSLLIPLVVIIILLVAAAPAYYFYTQYNKSQALLSNPSQAAVEELKSVKDKVGKLIELPSNEEPTLATVSDKNQLAGVALFAKAENGDKVLIYTKAGKAYLYRPSLNKLIEVTSVSLNQNASTASPSATPTQTKPKPPK